MKNGSAIAVRKTAGSSARNAESIGRKNGAAPAEQKMKGISVWRAETPVSKMVGTAYFRKWDEPGIRLLHDIGRKRRRRDVPEREIL